MAKHLSNTYGDRASVVARLCHMTGKRWPVVGHRLHVEFPYVDAEVVFLFLLCCRIISHSSLFPCRKEWDVFFFEDSKIIKTLYL